jgi:hypothetical protein
VTNMRPAGRPLAVSTRAEDETFWREFAPLVGLAGADPPTAGARKIKNEEAIRISVVSHRQMS